MIMKNRQSNFELLKVISMILIIMFHYVYKSGYNYDGLNLNSFIVKFFYYFGELGVNLFILITGYFMIKSKFSFKKLVLLITSVNFYYLLSVVIGYYLKIDYFDFTFKNIVLSFFSCIFNRYWFITAYLIIYIFSPYINKFIKSISKNQLKKFLLISLLIWSIIPTFFGLVYNSSETLLYYSRLIWLLVMYFVGAYIRLYSLNYYNSNKRIIKTIIICLLVLIVSIIIISKYINVFKKIGTTEVAYLWTPNNIVMFILSISIFGLFMKLEIKSNLIINALASTTLGIYMIHDGLLNKFIWKNIFNTFDKLNSNYLLFYIIIDSAIIFLVCFLFEFIRKQVEKITISKLLDYISKSSSISKINRKTNNMIKKI